MNLRSLLPSLGAWAALLSAGPLPAQTPGLVMFFKTLSVTQTSASSQESFEPALGLVVSFSGAVSSSTVVQLTGNGVVLSVPRVTPQVYVLEQVFASDAELARAVPDGTYVLTVTGGGANSSITLVMPRPVEFRPVLFSNFDRLQAWPDSTVRFTWEAIQGTGNLDSLTFSVTRADGTPLYESPTFGQSGALPGTATSIDVPGLPRDEPLFATLTYIRMSIGFVNGLATMTATGRGFVVRTPLRIVSAKPQIARQPRAQTMAAGSTVVFSADVTGENLACQWRRNGVPIAGATSATLVLPNVTTAQTGFYTMDATNPSGSVTTEAVSLIVANSALPGRITNLAIRSRSGSAAQTLIVGFAIGPASLPGTKPVLVRGIGPALGDFGVPGVLADPKIELYSGANRISENDDWSGNAQIAAVARSVGAFPLTTPSSKDAALYHPAFATGSYSVQLTGAANTTGVALAEIYDASPGVSYTAASPRLINVSARSQVGTGADLLIAGFVISGDNPKTVLLRAVGPTLAGFGVSGTLADPKLELFSGPVKLQENDNWGGDPALRTAALNAGAFALSTASRDAALLVTLPPGGYTAQVAGVNNTSGIALVEIYEVP